jgi:hypothetical protein
MMDFLSRTPPKAAVAIFFYLLLLYLFMPIRTPLNFYDEGFAVFNPVRVLNGELPYRDFWAIYPPGQLFSLAGVYKILGVSLLASRVYDTWVRFALVIAVFLVARKITTSWLAYSAALVATLMMASVGFYGYAVYPALAWGIFALWCALKFGETGRPRWLVLAGVLMGVSTFFRWDIGLYGVIGLTAALLLRQFIGAWRAGQSFYRSAGSGLKIASWLLLPAGAAILILYGWVSLKSGLGNVWSQVVWFPARQLHDVRWLAYPRLVPAVAKLSDWWDSYSPWMDWLRFYLPLTVYALAIVYLGHAFLIRRIELDNRRFGILAAALFGLLTFAQALSRYDYIHALPTGVFAFLVVVGLVYQALCASKATHLRIAILVLAPGILAVYFASTVNSYLLTMDHWPPWGCYSTFPPASCAYIGENRQRAVEYLQGGAAAFVDGPHHQALPAAHIAGREDARNAGGKLAIRGAHIAALVALDVPAAQAADLRGPRKPIASSTSWAGQTFLGAGDFARAPGGRWPGHPLDLHGMHFLNMPVLVAHKALGRDAELARVLAKDGDRPLPGRNPLEHARPFGPGVVGLAVERRALQDFKLDQAAAAVAQGGAHAVGAGIAAADHDHIFAAG